MKRENAFNFVYLVVALIAIVFLRDLWVQQQKIDQIPYSEFRALLEAGRVGEVAVGDTYIRGTLANPAVGEKPEFITDKLQTDVADFLAKYKIKYQAEHDSGWLKAILSWIVPTAAVRRHLDVRHPPHADRHGAGRRPAGDRQEQGAHLSREEHRCRFRRRGRRRRGQGRAARRSSISSRIPRSTAAWARACPRASCWSARPARARRCWRARSPERRACRSSRSRARNSSRCSWAWAPPACATSSSRPASTRPASSSSTSSTRSGRARGTFTLGGHDEKEQTLNQLLAELDGFDPKTGIVLLAATNRPEILDPALLRAGRFDRQVLVDRPDKKGRVDILDRSCPQGATGDDVELGQVAALTPGFTGADLANLVNEAALLATRRNAEDVTLDDFTQAIERIVAGLEKRNRILNPKERELIAFHETGHALVAMALPGIDPVQKISIIPRGVGALGYTMQRPIEDRFLMSQNELENRLTVLLGGRAAEMLRLPVGLDRRRRRPAKGDRHRAQHGHALRHGDRAGRRRL